ncbi:MAG: molybdopterin-dependent oxidoreductase [Rhodobacteraceae bacterium]|nr:molybdopterin-dependent oxidoreductase [Paracoccaceae bacterium]
MKTARLHAALFATIVTAMPAAADRPILTLTGAVRDAPVTLTRSDLKALPQHELTTSSSVTDGTPVFEGFLMRDLLARHDAEGDSVQALALNDYQIEIPVSDFLDFDVIGALYQDGQPLSPRDKGPVWIVYPRDDHARLQDIRYDTRWVWQLSTLHVE